MPILLSEMDATRAALDKLMQEEPRRQPERITTAAAIAEFAPKIRALLKAGHSLADIAACLTLGGCPVSVPQLQRYLKGAQARAATKKSRTAKGANASAPKGTTGSGSQEKPTGDPSESTTAQLGLSLYGGSTPATVAPTGSRSADQTRVTAAASFTPRPNTSGTVASTGAGTQVSATAAEASPAQAKPQSTPSPVTDDLTVAEVQNRAAERIRGMAPSSTKADRPHEPTIAWRGMGMTPSRDDAPSQARAEPGKPL